MSLPNHFGRLLAICCLFFLVSWTPPARALAPSAPRFANAYELIDAVNSLRAQNGLPGYSINSILMGIAQAHSDYQAAIGAWTHYGPNGDDERDRALAAGYPVGAIDENVWMGQNLDAQQVVNNWSGDAPHLGNMLSAVYTEAGAGVSCSGDYCYFTLDVAQPSGAPIVPTPTGGTAAPTSTGGGTVFPTRLVVFPNTPKPDGSVTHIVQPGETLSTISLAYKTTVDSLKSLNRLDSDLIYPGDTLIIFLARPTETAAPTETETPAPTATPFVFRTATRPPEPTATHPPAAPLAGGSGAIVVGIIIVAALVVAGVLTAASARPVRKREE